MMMKFFTKKKNDDEITSVTRKGSATYQPRALQRCPHKKKKKTLLI